MTQFYTSKKKLLRLFLFMGSTFTWGQTQQIHYWNFNALPSGTLTTVAPDASLIPTGTQITYPGTGAGYMDNVAGSALNAQNGDAAGLGLRPRNPSNTRALLVTAPTTGYQNIIIKFATTRTTQGASSQNYSYTLNGTDFITTGLAVTTYAPQTEPTYEVVTLDFSGIAGAANNPDFALKIEFGGSTAAGSSGNNRFDNLTITGSTAGGNDTSSPVATFNPTHNATNVAINTQPTISFNEDVRLIDNSPITNTNVDALVELRLGGVTGTSVPFDATFSNNTITISPLQTLSNSATYAVLLAPNQIEDMHDNALTNSAAIQFSTVAFDTKIAMASNFVTVNENHGTLSFNLNLTNPANASVDLVVKAAPFSTADQNDFTLQTQTLHFTAGSNTTQTISIPIIDDTQEEQHAEYFVLSLENPVGLSITGNPMATVYIKDNDRQAPSPTNDIQLEYVGSFDPSGASTSSCEIIVHDPATQRLFTISAISDKLEIIDFSNPTSLSVINSINMAPYGGITSVAVKNGVVAVASPNANEQLNGSVVFFDTNGTFLKQVTVGALPDMVTFTPDGTKVLTANEGQPNDAYTVDPEGSVSIIDISGGIASLTQANVTTASFTAFNAQEAALMASGVRKTKSTSTLAQDLEPEYITIRPDSQKAWVTLQENNAIAEIDLVTKTISDIWALGTKDISLPGNGMDISDNNNEVLIANWPIQAYYIPDAVANYTVNGTTYLVMANEGDEKEYAGLTERTTVGANTYTLDPAIFPNASVLKQNHNAGRLRVTNLNGNTDADADFEEIKILGSRSFSIFNADTKAIVFDSGDDFEMYTAMTPSISPIFNADHGDNVKKGRSRAKGPEPEGVTLTQIAGKTFAFITLERVGGVMVYDVTNPSDVKFVDYKNSRSTSAYSGDFGPEGVTFIKAADSPNNKNYVAIANEISGTISMYEVNTANLTNDDFVHAPKTFTVFPNPSTKGVVYFNRMASYSLYDLTGKLIQSEKNALLINTSKLTAGMYLIQTDEGLTQKLVVK